MTGTWGRRTKMPKYIEFAPRKTYTYQCAEEMWSHGQRQTKFNKVISELNLDDTMKGSVAPSRIDLL